MSPHKKCNVVEGFVPCFGSYLHNDYPLSKIFEDVIVFTKVKALLNELLESTNPVHLTQHEAQKIQPNNLEGKRLIRLIKSDYPLVRIDFGDCSLRVLYSYQNDPRIVHVHIIDTTHDTYNGKNRR